MESAVSADAAENRDAAEPSEEGGDGAGGTLPPEFFTPLDTFDAVRHMLENLDEEHGLSPPYLSAQAHSCTRHTRTPRERKRAPIGSLSHRMRQLR